MGEAKRVSKARASGVNFDPLVQERLKRAQDQIRAKFKRVEARSESLDRINGLDTDLERDMDPRIYGGLRRSAKIQDTPRVRQEGAGKRGGNCYRTACQKPGATFFNHSTHQWYCKDCAHWLNTDTFNQKDAMDLYGGPLCISEEEYDAMPQEDKTYGRSRLRTERREHPENF